MVEYWTYSFALIQNLDSIVNGSLETMGFRADLLQKFHQLLGKQHDRRDVEDITMEELEKLAKYVDTFEKIYDKLNFIQSQTSLLLHDWNSC